MNIKVIVLTIFVAIVSLCIGYSAGMRDGSAITAAFNNVGLSGMSALSSMAVQKTDESESLKRAIEIQNIALADMFIKNLEFISKDKQYWTILPLPDHLKTDKESYNNLICGLLDIAERTNIKNKKIYIVTSKLESRCK